MRRAAGLLGGRKEKRWAGASGGNEGVCSALRRVADRPSRNIPNKRSRTGREDAASTSGTATAPCSATTDKTCTEDQDAEIKTASPEDACEGTRRPKRKVAVLVGYSGTGYRGMQLWVLCISTLSVPRTTFTLSPPFRLQEGVGPLACHPYRIYVIWRRASATRTSRACVPSITHPLIV